MTAMAGIDQALWDIAGKFYEVPVYTLLGGKYRGRIKAYGTFEPVDDIDKTRFTARDMKKRGYTSLKVGGGAFGYDADLDYEIVKTVRDELGDDFNLQIDVVGLPSGIVSGGLARKYQCLRANGLRFNPLAMIKI